MKKSPEEKSKELSSKLDPLRSFVERTSVVRFPMRRLFSACLKASFISTFELVDFVSKQNADIAFFLPPALRRPTEDVIFLRFISKIPHEEREKFIRDMMNLGTARNLKWQRLFFEKFRPFQPILKEIKEQTDIAQIEDTVQSFWRKNGWLKFRIDTKLHPPVRQIAEKSDPGLLDIVYDFIYRLTSGTVHFNPQILLRSGWGSTRKEVVVSPVNMGPYYLAVSQIYGSFILCLYFEFFGRFLKPNREEKEAIKELRKHLLGIPRWPEIVTYEEMNIPIPNPGFWPRALIHALYSIIMEEGFISGANSILKEGS